MNILEYAKNINEYNQRHKTTLAHGMEWKKHKYIRKEGDRYIYPEDLNANKMLTSRYSNALSTASNAKIEKQKQEAIAKNAEAAKNGGDAARYANTPSAQKKIDEAVKKNAEAAQNGGDAARYAYNPEVMRTEKPVNTKEYLEKKVINTYANGLSTLNKMLDEYKRKYNSGELYARNNPLGDVKELNKIRDYADKISEELSKLDLYKSMDFTREASSRIRSISEYDKRYEGVGSGLSSYYSPDSREAVQKNADAAKYGGDAARYAKKYNSQKNRW